MEGHPHLDQPTEAHQTPSDYVEMGKKPTLRFTNQSAIRYLESKRWPYESLEHIDKETGNVLKINPKTASLIGDPFIKVEETVEHKLKEDEHREAAQIASMTLNAPLTDNEIKLLSDKPARLPTREEMIEVSKARKKTKTLNTGEPHSDQPTESKAHPKSDKVSLEKKETLPFTLDSAWAYLNKKIGPRKLRFAYKEGPIFKVDETNYHLTGDPFVQLKPLEPITNNDAIFLEPEEEAALQTLNAQPTEDELKWREEHPTRWATEEELQKLAAEKPTTDDAVTMLRKRMDDREPGATWSPPNVETQTAPLQQIETKEKRSRKWLQTAAQATAAIMLAWGLSGQDKTPAKIPSINPDLKETETNIQTETEANLPALSVVTGELKSIVTNEVLNSPVVAINFDLFPRNSKVENIEVAIVNQSDESEGQGEVIAHLEIDDENTSVSSIQSNGEGISIPELVEESQQIETNREGGPNTLYVPILAGVQPEQIFNTVIYSGGKTIPDSEFPGITEDNVLFANEPISPKTFVSAEIRFIAPSGLPNKNGQTRSEIPLGNGKSEYTTSLIWEARDSS